MAHDITIKDLRCLQHVPWFHSLPFMFLLLFIKNFWKDVMIRQAQGDWSMPTGVGKQSIIAPTTKRKLERLVRRTFRSPFAIPVTEKWDHFRPSIP